MLSGFFFFLASLGFERNRFSLELVGWGVEGLAFHLLLMSCKRS